MRMSNHSNILSLKAAVVNPSFGQTHGQVQERKQKHTHIVYTFCLKVCFIGQKAKE